MSNIDIKEKTGPLLIRVPYLSGTLVNLLIFGVIIAVWVSIKFDPRLYHLSIQEDQIIEWMTFWVFFISGIIFFQAAYRQNAIMFKIPWFLVGMGIFCLFVAMEEISWGQRLFSYRPPTYFLEQNFQQEFNFHNVVDKFWRKLTLKVIIIGYGVVLPVCWLVPPVRRVCWKLGIVPPPVLFTPAFLSTYGLYEVYPWKFSGELVELMLGLGFVFSATALTSFFKEPSAIRHFNSLSIIALTIIIISLGSGMTYINARLHHRPELIDMTKKEITALGYDIRKAMNLSSGPIPRSKLNKRLYTFVKKYKVDRIYSGNFQSLTRQGLPEERAQFFIDPWNTPYWISQTWDLERKKTKIFVYSFGPNRRRDSFFWEISGDDIGMIVYSNF